MGRNDFFHIGQSQPGATLARAALKWFEKKFLGFFRQAGPCVFYGNDVEIIFHAEGDDDVSFVFVFHGFKSISGQIGQDAENLVRIGIELKVGRYLVDEANITVFVQL